MGKQSRLTGRTPDEAAHRLAGRLDRKDETKGTRTAAVPQLNGLRQSPIKESLGSGIACKPPSKPRFSRTFRALGALSLPGILAGCGMVVLDPSGYVALEQRSLIIASTVLMLLIIVPVIVLTLVFARRYREGNTNAPYDPEWHHSTQLEVVIWAAPLVIIVCLGAMTWLSTHTLDPYRPLSQIGRSQPVPPNTKPVNVQVVALDW